MPRIVLTRVRRELFLETGTELTRVCRELFLEPGTELTRVCRELFLEPGTELTRVCRELFLEPGTKLTRVCRELFLEPGTELTRVCRELFLEPGTELTRVVAGEGVGDVRQAVINWRYVQAYYSPVSWRIMTAPVVYINSVLVIAIDTGERYTMHRINLIFHIK